LDVHKCIEEKNLLIKVSILRISEKNNGQLKKQPQKASDYLKGNSKLFFITIGLILVI